MHVDKKRISIQGWYHGAAPPPGSDVATIAQLTSARALNAEASVFAALSPSIGALKAEDYESLSEFISVAYLKPNVVKQLRQQFNREGSVQLLNFIRSEYADKFSESVRCSFAGLPAPSRPSRAPRLLSIACAQHTCAAKRIFLRLNHHADRRSGCGGWSRQWRACVARRWRQFALASGRASAHAAFPPVQAGHRGG